MAVFAWVRSSMRLSRNDLDGLGLNSGGPLGLLVENTARNGAEGAVVEKGDSLVQQPLVPKAGTERSRGLSDLSHAAEGSEGSGIFYRGRRSRGSNRKGRGLPITSLRNCGCEALIR